MRGEELETETTRHVGTTEAAAWKYKKQWGKGGFAWMVGKGNPQMAEGGMC